MKLGTVITAMVTPFDNSGRVAYDKAAELADHLAKNGSDGLVVAGTTGESPTLSSDEKIRLATVVRQAVNGRARVFLNTGSNDTAASVDLTEKATAIGLDGIMAVVPYYNKPPQSGLLLHFKSVARATDLPVMVYNVPGRTGCNLLPETLEKLAEQPNVVACKEASGNLEQVSEIARRVGERVQILSGDDSLTLPMLAVGATGVVSVASHLVGERIQRMISAFFEGDVMQAKKIHLELLPMFKGLFFTTNPIPVKSALNMLGHGLGGFRPPLSPLDPPQEAFLAGLLESYGLK
ncbi:MAG: 4-hydroxy-tetrahydrodipicolinate synthase [Bacillota bacterium]